MTTPHDVLREAARILMRNGWWDGANGEPGSVCAAVAIGRAAGPSGGVLNGALNHFAAFLGITVFGGAVTVDEIAEWNDAPERTAEDVILALKRAAEES